MSQNYRITSVKETNFDPDSYGNRFWSITFEGIQGNALWKTKNRPESGVTVFGHLEQSKSGKSTIFKKDQKPDDYVEKPAGTSYAEQLQQKPVQAELIDVSQPTNAQILDASRKLYKRMEERFEVIENLIAGMGIDMETKKFIAAQTPSQEPGHGPNRDPEAEIEAFKEDMKADMETGEDYPVDNIPF